MPLIIILLCLIATPALADAVHIDGPLGNLEAERIAVTGADHVVVIVPGSGLTDRDGNSPAVGIATDFYKLLAQDLAAQGIASLRIDKRGLFGSRAAISDMNDVSVADYAGDVRGWVEFASALAPCVWIAGHSEGGLVALAAAQSPPEHLCGLILLATPGRPLGQVLLEQLSANPANAPLMTEIESIIADLEAGRTRNSADMTPVLRPLFADRVQPFMIDLFAHDPAQEAARWPGPALVVQGDRDIQVRPVDAQLLDAALPEAKRVDIRGATHMFKQDVPGKPFATYADKTMPLHPDLVPAIAAFLKGAAR